MKRDPVRSANLMVLAALLSGCVASGPTPQRAAFQQAALQSLVACMKLRASQLDDHRSDAATIGEAVASACGPEGTEAIKAGGSPYTMGEAYFSYEARVRASFPAMATEAVLLERRQPR